MVHRTTIVVGLLTACSCASPDSGFGDEMEWVHDPSRLVTEDGYPVLYSSGAEGVALRRARVDLDASTVTPLPGLMADGLTDGWWQEVQEWNPTGEFDAPTLSDDGQWLAFTVFDEQDEDIRDVTAVARRDGEGWMPAQIVLESFGEDSDTPRAMDASFFSSGDALHLVFGSHAGGIYLTPLDADTGMLSEAPDTPDTTQTSDRFTLLADDRERGIEAPYLHAHDGWHYLFVNKGQCCMGTSSTYAIVVGRSKDPFGPYIDEDDVDLRDGGGTTFLDTEGRFIGPGHVGIQTIDGDAYLGFHFYDADDNGRAKYALHELSWSDEGWPVLGGVRVAQ